LLLIEFISCFLSNQEPPVIVDTPRERQAGMAACGLLLLISYHHSSIKLIEKICLFVSEQMKEMLPRPCLCRGKFQLIIMGVTQAAQAMILALH